MKKYLHKCKAPFVQLEGKKLTTQKALLLNILKARQSQTSRNGKDLIFSLLN